MSRRVAISGIGVVTCLGNDIKDTWNNLLEGYSGIDTITSFDASSFPTRIAAEVKDFRPKDFVPRQFRTISDKRVAMALACARMAITDANVDLRKLDPRRFGVVMGAETGRITLSRLLNIYHHLFKNGKMETTSYRLKSDLLFDRDEFVKNQSNLPATLISHLFNARSHCMTISSACTSGAQAIIEAAEIIRSGETDVMLAGGVSVDVDVYALMGFGLLGALSCNNANPKEALRPFDAKRDGFVLGEGAGIMLIEDMEHARRRNGRIYGEIKGVASSNDAYRITDPLEDGYGAYLAMKNAILDAGLCPEDIDYINAHGTSTIMNDRAETAAIKRCFGERAYKLPISSIKSAMGHPISASGAIELIITLFTIKDGIIPPTLNYKYFDPYCDLDYVADGPRNAKIKIAMSNSFGFGGSNVSIVVGN